MRQENTMGVDERAYQELFNSPRAAGCGVTHGGMCDPSGGRNINRQHVPNPSMLVNSKRLVELVNQQ